MLKTISEIINQLVDAHEKKKDVNLNRFVLTLSVNLMFLVPLACDQ